VRIKQIISQISHLLCAAGSCVWVGWKTFWEGDTEDVTHLLLIRLGQQRHRDRLSVCRGPLSSHPRSRVSHWGQRGKAPQESFSFCSWCLSYNLADCRGLRAVRTT